MNPLRLEIYKEEHSAFVCHGVLNISSFRGGLGRVRIHLDTGATLEVCGDFHLGNGTEIFLSSGAHLTIGGKAGENACGVTENTRIMVHKKITIGKDFLCAWRVFITDCDWHLIENRSPQSDVVIGDHVWITPNCSILKGTHIGDGCVVATGTVVNGKRFPDRCLIGGNPAKVLQSEVQWQWDLLPKVAKGRQKTADARAL